MTKMHRFALGFALVCLLVSLCSPRNVVAQSETREIRLVVFLDYTRPQVGSDGTVIFNGSVDPLVSSRPNLQTWGFGQDYVELLGTDGEKWYIQGSISTARLMFPKMDKWYHLHLGPLALAPGDNLTFVFPFMNLDYEHIQPPPDNLTELITHTARPAIIPTTFVRLRYAGTGLNGVTLDIPFTPIRKQIDLTLTPLIGEMLLNHTPNFHLSGHVIYDQIDNYVGFSWDCRSDPVDQATRYDAAHLLFALDSPPKIMAGMLSDFHQNKRTYTFVRLAPLSCLYDAKEGGRIKAAFNGQVYKTAQFSQTAQLLPDKWVDTLERNEAIEPDLNEPDRRKYVLEMGDIVLAPGDLLTVTIPGAQIYHVDPPPTRVDSVRGHSTKIVYEGPLYSKIALVYEPATNLILSQLHTVVRTGTRSIEQKLGPVWGRNDRIGLQDTRLTWWLGLLAVTLFAARIRIRNAKLRLWTTTLAWTLTAIVLFYGFHSVYGLLGVAVLIYLSAGMGARPLVGYLVRGGAAVLLIFAAIFLDQYAAQNLFTILQEMELEITPVSPLILFVLGLGLAVLLTIPVVQFKPLFPRVILAIVLGLVPLALFDALQKSLLSLAVLGIGMAFILHRLKKNGKEMDYVDVIARLRRVWNDRLMLVGFIILILFASQNGLQSTTAVLGSMPSILSALVLPFLLVISILTSFLASGLLFIILYPILPFHIGYLKAAVFGLFLLLTFFVGIGADENLASTWQTLIIGRLVYYLGVSLLIGLFFDITTPREQPTDTGTKRPPPLLNLLQGSSQGL